MLWRHANLVVEDLRVDTRLYLPGLTKRRGFSSSRVEHLLNRLVKDMPANECYVEVGTLEGRTLEAASVGNDDKRLYGIDPCEKYGEIPEALGPNVTLLVDTWQHALGFSAFKFPLGLVFYDGDHSAEETCAFMRTVWPLMAREAVLVLDDWDRVSVRDGAFQAAELGYWQLLREMPSYGDGLTCPQDHFGWSFGVSIWGFRR